MRYKAPQSKNTRVPIIAKRIKTLKKKWNKNLKNEGIIFYKGMFSSLNLLSHSPYHLEYL